MPALRTILLAAVVLLALAAPAGAATLVGDYNLDENLTSSVGGPALTPLGTASYASETVGGASEKVYLFPAGGGLHLPAGGLQANDDYSLVFTFRLETITGFRRVLNFRAFDGPSKTDAGLYAGEGAVPGQLDYWNGTTNNYGPSLDPLPQNAYAQLAVVRQEVTTAGVPRFHVYKDGSHQLSASDTPDITNFTSEGFEFFKDEQAGTEESAGAVARIRVYKGVLTETEISSIAAGGAGPGPAPAGPSDTDGDGVADASDNCPSVANATQNDLDGDGHGDVCDDDDDGDGVTDASDTCQGVNAGQQDTDGDGQGDACDADDDGDGIEDASDNCSSTPSAGQGGLDPDADGKGNACDADDDGDGRVDTADNCPVLANAGQEDIDADKVGDACDADDDNDGVLDGIDTCPTVTRAGANGCPPSRLEKGGATGAQAAGKGIKVAAGFKAACPLGLIECTLNALVATNSAGATAAKVITLGVLKVKMKPGQTKAVVIKLSKKGARLLRKAKKLRVTLKISLVGPDGNAVKVTRKLKLKAPS